MHFSSRVVFRSNPIAYDAANTALGKLNDLVLRWASSMVVRRDMDWLHALVPSVYTADPRGSYAVREALAAFLNEANAGRSQMNASAIPPAGREAGAIVCVELHIRGILMADQTVM